MFNLVIKNGHVIDPSTQTDCIKTISVKNGYIEEFNEKESVVETIDATGCLVVPGLIDAHSHCFFSGSGLCVQPDLFASTGVTATIDAGSAGWSNFTAFHNTVIANSIVRVKGLVAYNNAGQVELGSYINYDPKTIKQHKIKALFEKYPNDLLGLKMLFQKGIAGDDETSLARIDEMISLAEDIGCPVTIHTTNPPAPTPQILKRLRKGDTYCHCYQGKGYTILNSDNNVCKEAWEARERGVIFDAANGVNNFSSYVARHAIADGFLPDTISSDNSAHSFNLGVHVKNLPFIMSKYLALGMNLYDVIRCTTENAAKTFNQEGIIGTLQAGAYADIAILKLVNKKQVFADSENSEESTVIGQQILVPQMTVINGMVAYRSNEL
ncbi:amidohydrolase family protein [Succinatimonas hippei]|uniref:amidohydrolase family protein n=1 Tax=Succinatimonas hippei TaxID=626938 RepID=UPI0026F04BB7|nr:amidohydrolase family protein [Succinatimonas hippei]